MPIVRTSYLHRSLKRLSNPIMPVVQLSQRPRIDSIYLVSCAHKDLCYAAIIYNVFATCSKSVSAYGVVEQLELVFVFETTILYFLIQNLRCCANAICSDKTLGSTECWNLHPLTFYAYEKKRRMLERQRPRQRPRRVANDCATIRAASVLLQQF
jgi:hypothetical protein